MQRWDSPKLKPAAAEPSCGSTGRSANRPVTAHVGLDEGCCDAEVIGQKEKLPICALRIEATRNSDVRIGPQPSEQVSN